MFFSLLDDILEKVKIFGNASNERVGNFVNVERDTRLGRSGSIVVVAIVISHERYGMERQHATV